MMNTITHTSVANILADTQQRATKQAKFMAQFASAIEAAQKLRAQTFGQEYGVHFDHPQGLDVDSYDTHCLHLNVYDTTQGRLIATTRLLTVENSRLTKGFYCVRCSKLSKALRTTLFEVGLILIWFL